MSFCQFEGAPCLQHTNYVFYKAFRYKSDDNNRILSSGDFFFLKISHEDPVCIGEVELLWEDKSSNQYLASIRLYFRPEHTPQGRQDDTGEDEVIALGDRLVLKLEDLSPLIRHDINWAYGSSSYCSRSDKNGDTDSDWPGKCEGSELNGEDYCVSDVVKNGEVPADETGKKWNLSVQDVKIIKSMNSRKACSGAANLAVMSYPKYCRYRAVQKRLEGCENDWLHLAVIDAIGGVSGRAPGCRVMFCRDTFFQAEYDELDIRMDHMLPVLKGRTKGKKSKAPPQKDSNQDSDSVEENFANVAPTITLSKRPRRSTESSDLSEEKVSTEEQAFLIGLHKFMHDAKMPIGRIPSLGFKQIDLFYFYKQAEKLGGYDTITTKRMWKHLYDKLGGNQSNTSAATCTRKHYERLLLPYERHLQKQKVVKGKKKSQKFLDRESNSKQDVRGDTSQTTVPEVVNSDIKTELKQEVEELNTKDISRPASDDHPQCMKHESTLVEEDQKPAITEHSKPDSQSETEVLEIPITKHRVQDGAVTHAADRKPVDAVSNFQHFSFAQVEQMQQQHQQQAVKYSAGLTPAVPSSVVIPGENPMMHYSNMVYQGGYLVPVLSHHMLQAPWGLIAPGVPPTSPSSSSTKSRSESVSSHLGSSLKDLSPLPSPVKTNQNPAAGAASTALDISSKISTGKFSLTSQPYQLASVSSRKASKAANTHAGNKHLSLHPIDNMQSAHQGMLSSQHFNSNDLSSSSESLASLLHPTPSGHRSQHHLPPAPSTIYLHPTSTNPFSVFQTPVTFPPPMAHSYPRKRAYPFDSPTSQLGGSFPSPDIVLDRIRNSTGLPRSNVAHTYAHSVRQRYEDPRQIFRQISQTAATSQNAVPSQRKESLLDFVTNKQSKSKNSGRKNQQSYSMFGHMSSQDLQQVLLQQGSIVSSSNAKVIDQIKPASNLNGLQSVQQSNKSSANIQHTSSLASSSKDGRLTSALFGTQFTALPRTSKPPEMPSPQTLMLDPSSAAAAAALSLNPHLHPAFMSPYLQPGATAMSPQLHMHANPFITPAQLSAYEEILRQNGYGPFLTASTSGISSKKN